MKTKPEATHTPTPWTLSEKDVAPEGSSWRINGDCEVEGFNGTSNCKLATVYSIEANAAFIVRAVNAHEDMLKALKDALFVIQGQSANGNYLDSSERDISLEGVLEQAIATAEGK